MSPRMLFAILAVALLACPVPALAQDSFLTPLGPVAEAQRGHLIRVTLVTMIAIVPVLIATPVILWRYHRTQDRAKYREDSLYRPDWQFSGPLEAVMWGVPFAIIAVLGWWLWHETDRLDPYEARGPDPLEVQAIGLDWKWLFIYPDEEIATLNELVIPVDRPVRVALTTDTVMQSFRISALAGQIYAMPGMRTELNFSASRPGTTRGENTQYSGKGFAEQSFAVTALPRDDWRAWRMAAADLTLDRAIYATLGRAATPSETMEMLGLGDRKAARFDLALPGLFDEVMARYHQGAPVPARRQPGAPSYAGGVDE
ncbi:cytochrome c oxidase subunit II [Roseovarius sp. SCSIO 43702]|uniref:cytochrome c oxidase subunit II n=1 Tax=Roseovarius sp. SCSIO 43702 TaxID=2823043 RepID=UPI00217610D3|nr:cytochrome ubiquinol oxidase subunit II [Roseovarius sp. SCSIO 43702]